MTLTANQCTATYIQINGRMVHDGYFIYGNNTQLKWVSLNNLVNTQGAK